MKKLLAILISLFLISGVYAKQYLYKITQKSGFLYCFNSTVKIKEELEKTLLNLITRGFSIVQVISVEADGYTIGYTIIYEDKK